MHTPACSTTLLPCISATPKVQPAASNFQHHLHRPLLEEQSPPEGLGGFLAVLKAAGGLDQLAKHT